MKLNLQLLYLIGIVPVTMSILLAPILIKQSMTWTDAQKYCRSAHFDLALCKTANDFVMLRSILAKQSITGLFWLGLYNDFDTWRWSQNDLPLKNITLRRWGSGEPNNLYGHESCAAIDQKGLWWDTVCTGPKTFICYDATGVNKFVGVPTLMTWVDAQSYCRQHYTDLASAFDLSDNNLLQQVATTLGFSWFGLFRDEWKWVDGTQVDKLLWQSPLPDNADPQENCGLLNSGKIADRKCTNLYYFFCDTVVQMKHIVKVQLKADESLLDPAVNSAILEKIKEKLGANFTVSWRHQPNGKIFQKKKSSMTGACDQV
ncbi:putative C-type lectin domain family 20 member A [Hemibagrus wyckioides]|uniref:putative C-type lectin domain family 20 member A n=1 Tax=Hemibagrus wyckioides TaxID=337641 RepID=UPI00266C2A83|nr:putative C-type lectin domain family 20 member A [Hemibagrus wyckioides]